jgi:UDP-N-acetyl-D-mannosaminuronic acid dehydrogenase
MLNEEYPRANVPRPGPAGGPCLSKDGYFLVEELTLPDFVLLAWKLNDSIPSHIVRRLARNLERCDIQLQGSPVAVLGRSFKRDSDDPRQSPAERVATILLREGADVRVHDPYFAGPSIENSLSAAKAFVLATNHSAYDRLEPSDVASWMDPPRIGMDCWGVLDRAAFEEAGVKIITFGVGEEL